MLQKIGWIKLDENADPSAITQDDITENPHNIKFTEMNSMTIPATMADFDYVAITGSVVYNAGIDASTALANEDIQDYLVLQVVVKKENKDEEASENRRKARDEAADNQGNQEMRGIKAGA